MLAGTILSEQGCHWRKKVAEKCRHKSCLWAHVIFFITNRSPVNWMYSILFSGSYKSIPAFLVKIKGLGTNHSFANVFETYLKKRLSCCFAKNSIHTAITICNNIMQEHKQVVHYLDFEINLFQAHVRLMWCPSYLCETFLTWVFTLRFPIIVAPR